MTESYNVTKDTNFGANYVALVELEATELPIGSVASLEATESSLDGFSSPREYQRSPRGSNDPRSPRGSNYPRSPISYKVAKRNNIPEELSLVRTKNFVKCSKCVSDIEHSRIAIVCISCGAQLSSRPYSWRFM